MKPLLSIIFIWCIWLVVVSPICGLSVLLSIVMWDKRYMEMTVAFEEYYFSKKH